MCEQTDKPTDKDCMYTVGIKLQGFVMDLSLPDTPGQPEKSLARHLCRNGFEVDEVVQIIKEYRWRAYLRAVSLGFGMRGSDINHHESLMRIRESFENGIPPAVVVKNISAPLLGDLGL